MDGIYGEDLTHLAHANDDSKVDCLPWIEADDMANRWCALELNTFGDPELDMWTDVPQALSPGYDPVYVIGVGTFDVDVPGVSGALVACNFGGQLVGRGYTNPSGHVTLTLDPAPMEPGAMEIVVTAHNYLEHSGSVTVILPEGAYLLYESLTINDSDDNNNGLFDFAEDVRLSITVENVGMEAGSGVQVSISTADPYVTVHDDTADYGTIPAESTKTIPDGFDIELASSVPDQHLIAFAFSATDGDSIWTDDFTIRAHAPVLGIDRVMALDGENGRLDPGETTDLEVTLLNAGSAGLVNIQATLSCGDAYITINSNLDDLSSLGPSTTGVVIFNVTASSEAPIGHPAEFGLAVTATNYNFSDSFVLAIGLCVEDFENGGFASYPWEMGGNLPWTISTSGVYEGSHCAKSGTITHLQYSEMSVNLDVRADSPVSFYYKVSSESNNDYLRFYLDHVLLGQWSGQADWTQVSFDVTAGNHTFTWIYTKDQYTSSGSDCAWLDYIIFPPVDNPPELPPAAACYDFEAGNQGWIAGAGDDNALRGIWGRMDPEGTAFVGNPVQPENDHTPAPGVNCWVTDGRLGAGPGSWDVDAGKTTLLSPVWDLSGYHHAVIELWSWYSNDEGPAPGSDNFVTDVSSDGGTSWVNLLTTTDDWEFWRRDRYVLEDHITLTDQVQLRVVVSDEGDDSFVEAAVDDACLYGAIPQPPEAVTDVTALVSGTDIVLQWTATTGAESYKIYRIADPFATLTPEDLIGTTEATTYTDAGVLTTAEMAFYVVVAANSQ
ncbi:MAG: hypothetical protein V1784_02090 [bacterium]